MGFGTKSYLPLLALVPVFNILWVFVCGFKGNEWAWKKRNYDSIDTFMKVQETWNRAGIAYFIITLILVGIWILLSSIIVELLFNSIASLDCPQ